MFYRISFQKNKKRKVLQNMIMIAIPLVSLLASAGGKEVDEQDDLFILVAPQNAVGNCIIDVSILMIECSTIIVGESNCT